MKPATLSAASSDAPAPAAPTAAPTAGPALGQPWPHESARAQVCGAAPYVDDLPELKGTLYAAPIVSPCAHGLLRGVDAAPALALPGVHGVVLAGDVPGDLWLPTPARDEPIFARERVQYLGQVLGLVVADSPAQARHAARAVQTDIAPLPAILTLEQALQAQSYVLPPVTLRRGDAAAALAAAPRRLCGRFEVGGQEHFYLEGQIAYALPLEQGQWLVHSSTQHPAEVQHWVAHALGLAQHAVRVECRRMGGGFGGKETQAGQIAVWAALAAHQFGRPVKLRLARREDFLITGKRHPFAYEYEVGFDDTGRIQGLRLQMAANCGFSADLSGPVADRAVFHCDNAYYLGDVEITSLRCKTHTQSHTAFRGFGGPQGMIAIEAILGDIARALGACRPLGVESENAPQRGQFLPDSQPHSGTMGQEDGKKWAAAAHSQPTIPKSDRLPWVDALDVRRRNLYDPDPAAGRHTTPYQMAVEDNILPQLLSQLELSAQYRSRQEAILLWNRRQPVLRRGLALTPVKFGISFTATQFNQAGALVHVYTDGSVQVNHGGTEMGQGLHTKVAQIVADELGVPLARVQVTASDTAKVPNASATAASSGTDLNGRAAQHAARQVRERLAALVARLDGCGPEQVRFADGLVHSPAQQRSFTALVQLAYAQRVQLWSDGFYRTPKIHYDKHTLTGRPFYYFAYGAACTEVALDTLTGESRVLRVDILHDAGHSINPAIDRGQIEGGFVQGMGWLTTEQLVWNDAGALTTCAPSTYKIPAAGDVPAQLRVDFWPERNREDTVGGSKAVGEPPFMLALSVYEALRNAIAAALNTEGADGMAGAAAKPFAAQPLRLDAPATPEHILRALGALAPD